MKPKGLTASFIFEAQSGNYGEGIGNISILKKLSRGDGSMYTYISRQALRYNIVEQMGCNSTPVEASGEGSKKVVQYAPSASITQYPEIDLFGYMKTAGSGENARTRSAVVRLSHAIALEPYSSDMDFSTNMGLARRNNLDNNISQSEIHHSFYAYTIAVDLERVGVEQDVNGKIVEEIKEAGEKANRIKNFLHTLQYLYRDIKGRRENLAPVFAIGGVYDRKNPFFENRLLVSKGKLRLDTLTSVLAAQKEIKEQTLVGLVEGVFANSADISTEYKAIPMAKFFDELCDKVGAYYHESSQN